MSVLVPLRLLRVARRGFPGRTGVERRPVYLGASARRCFVAQLKRFDAVLRTLTFKPFKMLFNECNSFQVLIKVHACGVNPVETYIRSGNYARKPALPYTPGSDVAGVIEGVGGRVTAFKVLHRAFIPYSL